MILKKRKNAGFLWIELATAMAVIAIILTSLAVSLNGFRKFNNYQMVRQRCISAAQAQLDSIAVSGSAIGKKDFTRLWPKLDISIEKTDGTDQWKGLKLFTVKTKAKSFSKDIEIELNRYILPKRED